MKISEMARVRGNALKTTHLVRYETAIDRGATRVLDIQCPYCGAGFGKQCRVGN
jgi:hypothetical protein